MQNGGCGNVDEVILEDTLPDSANLGYVATAWQFGRVPGQFDLITVGWISRKAKLVDDVWRSQESVRVGETRTDVCARPERSVDLQWLAKPVSLETATMLTDRPRPRHCLSFVYEDLPCPRSYLQRRLR